MLYDSRSQVGGRVYMTQGQGEANLDVGILLALEWEAR